MSHPYRVYKIIPEAYPCHDLDSSKIDVKQLERDFLEHQKLIAKRNRYLIPPDLRARLMANPRTK